MFGKFNKNQEETDKKPKRLPSITRIAFLAVFLCLALFAVFQRPSYELQADIPEIVDAGQSVYRVSCASCHGQSLEGQTNDVGKVPALDETGTSFTQNDQKLIAILKGPRHEMSDHLSDQAIISALSYMKSTWPLDIQQTHDRLNAAQD